MGDGFSRLPLVLGKAGSGPLLWRGKEVWARGVRGSWELPAGGGGWFLRHKEPGKLELSAGSWEYTRFHPDSVD